MLEVERAIRIAAPPERVFAFVADHRHTMRFIPHLERFDPVDGQEFGLGARFRWEGCLLGLRVRSEFEVTRFDPPRLMEAWTTRGPRSFARWDFESVREGTLAGFVIGVQVPRWLEVGSPLGLARVLGEPFLEAQLIAAIEVSLRNLRAFVQRLATTPGSPTVAVSGDAGL